MFCTILHWALTLSNAGIRTVNGNVTRIRSACCHVCSIPLLVYRPPNALKPSVTKTMALSFIIFAIVSRIIHPSSRNRIYCMVFFASSSVGTANAALQASDKPYVTILGPISLPQKRISIMVFATNWFTCYYSFFYYLSRTMNQIKWKILFQPFGYYCQYFRCIRHYRLNGSNSPEVKAAERDAATDAEEAVACPYAEGKTSIMQFPHLLLGVICSFPL